MNRLQLWVLCKVSFGKTDLLRATSYLQNYSYREISNKSSSSSSSSSSDSEDDNSAQAKKKATLNKLNLLLKDMLKEDATTTVASNLNLAKPPNKRAKKVPQTEEIKPRSEEQRIVSAVKDVAQSVGGDTKLTESELLTKLLSPAIENETTTMSLNEVIKGMKIDREPKPVEHSRSEQVRQILQQFKPKTKTDEGQPTSRKPRKAHVTQKLAPEMPMERIDLFGSEPLGIFTNKTELKEGGENKTWDILYERELKMAVTHPPSNYFQQMILWTEQGKLWKFPINNEQGLEQEANVYFAEHVFLEEHLEPWCPHKGPVRHFMELVCVGLSKNPYLTVEAKKEHIEWYRDYFESKKKLLEEVGALPLEHNKVEPVEK